MLNHDVVQVDGCQSLTEQAWVQIQTSPCGFYGWQRILRQVFLQALQFSPVSIIPLILHVHSFSYHSHCIILAIGSILK
jgi:hypothetical protein